MRLIQRINPLPYHRLIPQEPILFQIQIDLRLRRPILRKPHRRRRRVRPVRIAENGEIHQIILQDPGQLWEDEDAGSGGGRPVDVGQAFGVVARVEAKQVRVCLVSEGGVEVVGVAGDGGGTEGAAQPLDAVAGGGVRGFGHGRIHRLDLVDDGRDRGREGGADVVLEAGVVLDVGRGEEEAFVGVVAHHDLHVVVKVPFAEEPAWKVGHDPAVDYGAVDELAVGSALDRFPAGVDELGAVFGESS